VKSGDFNPGWDVAAVGACKRSGDCRDRFRLFDASVRAKGALAGASSLNSDYRENRRPRDKSTFKGKREPGPGPWVRDELLTYCRGTPPGTDLTFR